VLAGERTAVFQTRVHDVSGKLLGALGLAGYIVVVEDQRVQVAITGVEDVGDA